MFVVAQTAKRWCRLNRFLCLLAVLSVGGLACVNKPSKSHRCGKNGIYISVWKWRPEPMCFSIINHNNYLVEWLCGRCGRAVCVKRDIILLRLFYIAKIIYFINANIIRDVCERIYIYCNDVWGDNKMQKNNIKLAPMNVPYSHILHMCIRHKAQGTLHSSYNNNTRIQNRYTKAINTRYTNEPELVYSL